MHTADVRHFHASQVFHAIRSQPGVSQRDLSQITGCDRSTISIIVKHFESIGLVERDLARTQGQRGRPTEGLRIAPTSGILVGLHFKRAGIMRLVATGIDAQPLNMIDRPRPENPDDLPDAVRAGIVELCEANGRSLSDVKAIGVSVPGLVRLDGTLTHSSSLDWYDVPLRQMLNRRLGAPVFVDNDANGATLAEYFFGACAHLSDFIVIDGGQGLGGGVFQDNRLFRGKSGYAGEFGHLKVVKDGRICGCGAAGCLSAYISAPALIDRARRRAPVKSFDDLMGLAAAGNEQVLAGLDEAGHFLGVAMATLVNVFNPAAIVLSRIAARMWPYVQHSTRRALQENAMAAPVADVEIIVSKISTGPMPLSGVALALEGYTSLDTRQTAPW